MRCGVDSRVVRRCDRMRALPPADGNFECPDLRTIATPCSQLPSPLHSSGGMSEPRPVSRDLDQLHFSDGPRADRTPRRERGIVASVYIRVPLQHWPPGCRCSNSPQASVMTGSWTSCGVQCTDVTGRFACLGRARCSSGTRENVRTAFSN